MSSATESSIAITGIVRRNAEDVAGAHRNLFSFNHELQLALDHVAYLLVEVAMPGHV